MCGQSKRQGSGSIKEGNEKRKSQQVWGWWLVDRGLVNKRLDCFVLIQWGVGKVVGEQEQLTKVVSEWTEKNDDANLSLSRRATFAR